MRTHDGLLGLPLARALELLEAEGTPHRVLEYHAKRDLGSERRVVRVREDATGVQLVVCCFMTEVGGAHV